MATKPWSTAPSRGGRSAVRSTAHPEDDQHARPPETRRALRPLAAASITAVILVVAGAASAGRAAVDAGPCQPAAEQRSAWVNCMLAQMTVEQKVGQMFVVNGFGDTVDSTAADAVAANRTLYGPGISNIEDLIEAYQPGGIVYFTWSNDLTDPSQITELSNGIQRVALAQPTPTPMLISTDQEQGEVLRIGSPATVFPGNMALGATRDTKLAHRNAAITGRELRAMGINVDNAPVVDVNTNPKNAADGIRAFGDRTPFVSRFGTAQVRGYQRAGNVGAVAKHWPGLGDTDTNPDTGVTVSQQSLRALAKVSFPAFRAAMDAGVESVMVTHIVMPKIEPSGVPTTLSPTFVNGLLRERLGFDGVVVTDALNAQALEQYSPAEVALMAIRAGNDQLLEIGGFPHPNSRSNLVPAYEAVLAAVNSGEITIERVEQSVRRILEMKWRLGLATGPYTGDDRVDEMVGTAAHLEVARRTAKRSITLLRNRDDLLPLNPGSVDRVLVTGWGATATPLIADEIASRDVTTQSLHTGQNPDRAKIRQVKRAARDYDAVVVDTFNVWAPKSGGQVRLVRELAETGKPVIVVAIGTPYDIAYLRKFDAFIATYDFQHVSLNAAVAALFGHVDPGGKLPVTVPEARHPKRTLYPFGFGLSYSRGPADRRAGSGCDRRRSSCDRR